MEQPTDSSQQLKRPGHVLKLIKSMYGAKQAGQIWVSVLDQALRHWGFSSSRYDERIYFKSVGSDFLILSIVVDELSFASNSTNLMHRLKTRLRAEFNVKLFGKLTSFVGWNISRRDDDIKINQLGYVKHMLQDFGLDKAKRSHISSSSDCRCSAETRKRSMSQHARAQALPLADRQFDVPGCLYTP